MCFPTLPFPSHTDLALPSDLVLPSEWDHDTEMLNEEELSATSHEEAGKVLEQWQTDNDQDLDIMEVDEQIGSNLLGDEIFGTPPCVSPTHQQLGEIHMVTPDRQYSSAHYSPQENKSTYLDERYRATLLKLQESMKRSQDTRRALVVETPKTEKYARRNSVHGVLSNIENSSRQVNHYLRTIQRHV
ncbi:unnamed protein product [Cylindrotheca closterium]|uniref:Uncharacterized protein n=1 Tax=Cylindrotheca closterium TaxID=2856 RepID=A0AAD2CIZ7_9STRA|nr:unnamed protein product [Cylindrotheca closterium]